jgi:RNA polymerase sigma-70 factor, ECF subfamily
MSSDIPNMPGDTPDRLDRVVMDATRGGEAAITALFTELQPRLLRFLRAQESRAADDIAAEVWLAVARSIENFEGDWNDFRAWFFTIARRRLVDHRRAGARRPTESVDATVLELHPGAESTEEVALNGVSGQQAASLIASVLRGEQAQVVLLRVLGDLDVEQVASIMQRPTTWVRVTQHRALRKLADRLGHQVVVTR